MSFQEWFCISNDINYDCGCAATVASATTASSLAASSTSHRRCRDGEHANQWSVKCGTCDQCNCKWWWWWCSDSGGKKIKLL